MWRANRYRIAATATVLALIAGTATGKPDKRDQESDPAVAKLIASLQSSNFRTRQEASESLVKLGAPVLPTLRKSLRGETEIETKRRLEHVIGRIENVVLQAEEKLWKDLDAGKRGIKDRLVMIQAKTPTLSDPQLISAIYLITVGRAPTDDERKRAGEQFAESQSRTGITLRVALSLVQGKEYRPELADVNLRVLKAQKDLAGEDGIAKMLHKLNSPEYEKLINEAAAATVKVAKADEDNVDVAFLLTLSRFPSEQQKTPALGLLKREANRATATSNIYWALLNTKEFLIRK